MSDSPEAVCFADRACFQTVEVVENVRLATDTWRVRFHAPEMARRFVPGQFLMMRLAGYEDPMLGRPFALYDTGSSTIQPASLSARHRRRLSGHGQDDFADAGSIPPGG